MQILIHTSLKLRLLILAVFLGGHLGSGQTLTAPEYKIKAAFLYNFAILTEWPAEAFVSRESPLTIGILGKNPFDGFLEETVKGKTVFGRTVIIRKFESPANIKGCHLLFISASEQSRTGEIISDLDNQPILTVGESDAFQQAGGMIRLLKEENEIHFSINRSMAQRAGLKFSSRLLALNKEVSVNP